MYSKVILSIAILAIFISSCQQTKEPTPPMVDGDITDFQQLGVEPIELMQGSNLYLYQNDHFVWLGFDYPEESFGTMDLKLITPTLSDTLNMHISAQIGEWYLSEGSPRPDNPESDLWWNHQGWYANEVWPNGTDRSSENPQPKFKNAKAREIQISKERFGRGKWMMQAEIRAIRTGSGFTGTSFPKNGWYELTVF
ncbi:hypothetical protein [Ekhidna sp.]